MTVTRDALLREGMELLAHVARQLAKQLGHRVEARELEGHAHEALTTIVDRYDPGRGVAFRSFARLRLRGAMLDGLRKETDLPRGVLGRLRAVEAMDLYAEGKAEEVGVRADQASAADARLGAYLAGMATAYATGLACRGEDQRSEAEQDDPETLTAQREIRARIEQALGEIGDPEATILRRHYLEGDDLVTAAAAVGLSKSWGSRLHARGIEKLRKCLSDLA